MKNNFKKNNKSFKERGFTLLFAVLVSTLVLSVGASIISIALKQVILSGSARDSQFAFYASNTGIECALYWDLVGLDGVSDPIFATSSDSVVSGSGSGEIACGNTRNIIIDGNAVSDFGDDDGDFVLNDNWNLDVSSDSATTTFRVLLEDVSYCVDVSVAKFLDENNRVRTVINSRGYNTCDENNRRRIERGLRINY